MSRVDHIVVRRQEASRLARRGQKKFMVFDRKTGKWDAAPAHHHQGDKWWRLRFADLVDRRRTTYTKTKNGHTEITYQPRVKPVMARLAARGPVPDKADRPSGMSRQSQRRLYRAACKFAGAPRRSAGKA